MTTGRPPDAIEGVPAVADLIFVVLTLAVFGLLALLVRGMEDL